MNFLNLNPGSNNGSAPSFLNDSDNLLILVLALMLAKEKANLPLVIALMSILMTDGAGSAPAKFEN